MPALPNKSSRRKTTTPVVRQDPDYVFSEVLDTLGLEPLSSNNTRASKSNMDGIIIENPTTSSSSSSSSKKLSILNLPSETQKDIFKHVSSRDLIALALVCKHFRDLAAEQLYRTFHIVFPDEDDPSNDSQIDALAGGLDTLATSDYNYAQYLREIILETLSGGEKAERTYRHYLYDMSCGKFMNTLLLLSLRKARKLETFRWDIRVELSRPVFRTLHQIQSLQHLQLRMQTGPSIYEPPPLLTGQSLATNDASSIAEQDLIYIPPIPPPTSGTSTPNSFSLGPKSTKYNLQDRPSAKLPPTLSEFKNLKTLAVLDMDTLDYVDELKTCIQSCSSSLSSLKISFSEVLANKSRKPPPDPHSDDESDQEDEFTLGGLPPPSGLPSNTHQPASSFNNGVSKIVSAQLEKKRQEAVLGRIFGLEPKVVKVRAPEPEKVIKPEEDPKRKFIRSLAPVAAKLMAHIKPGSEASVEGKETLAMIENAAKLYIDSIDKGKGKASEKDGSSIAKVISVNASMGDGDDAGVSEAVVLAEPGLFDGEETRKKRTSDETGHPNPDDIDVEEPESEDLLIEFDFAVSDTKQEDVPETTKASQPPAENTDGVSDTEETNQSALPDTITEPPEAEGSPAPLDSINWANKLHILDRHLAIRSTHKEIEKQGDLLRKRMDEFKQKLQSGAVQAIDYKIIAEAEAEFQKVARRVEELSRNMQEVTDHIDELQNSGSLDDARMIEYIRDTRGLTLSSLSICLIPIKASVLSRAIDIHALQSITLLNVGPQIQFWNALARENKLQPLPLNKIHTDNVTLPFLAFVAHLDLLTELFLLERTAKARVESTASKTTVSMDQIRKVILRRHLGTMKVLMIRNDAGSEWDLDVKTMVMICHRGTALEELACSFGIRTMHAFLQSIPNMVSLRAIYTIQFRNDDACNWVMREFRKFTVDIVSHNPGMKLEYLALDNAIERIVRRTAIPRKTAVKNGKGKSTGFDLLSTNALAELALGNYNSGSGWDSASFDIAESSDDEDGLGRSGLRIETVEGVRFCDVVGVKIFEKEILSGRL